MSWAFHDELEKLGYSSREHRRLMSSTTQAAFGKDVGRQARQTLIRGAVRSDSGLRHPWLPWNDVQHAFPSVTKKELTQEIRIMRDSALKNLSKAIADKDMGKARRNVLMTRGLLGVGHAQHAQMDVGAHQNKPLEAAVKSGDLTAVKNVRRVRKIVRALPGYYGGFVSAGVEHLSSGRLSQKNEEAAKANLDRLQPSKFKSDRDTISSARTFGRSLKKALTTRLKKDHGLSGGQVKKLVKKRLREFKPTKVERFAGGFLDTGQHALQQVDRVRRLPRVMSDRQRMLFGSAKTLMKGIL